MIKADHLSRGTPLYPAQSTCLGIAEASGNSSTEKMAGEMSIPHLHYPQDNFRAGFVNLKQAATPSHPLEAALGQFTVHKTAEKKNILRSTQGLHSAMRMNMEQAILSQYRRLPGFHSEFVGLEVMGMHNDQIGFEDFLNDPRERMEAPQPMHEQMESRLGLTSVEPFHMPVKSARTLP